MIINSQPAFGWQIWDHSPDRYSLILEFKTLALIVNINMETGKYGIICNYLKRNQLFLLLGEKLETEPNDPVLTGLDLINDTIWCLLKGEKNNY